MNKIISEAGVSWENCKVVDVDITAVNIGSRNSIMTRVRKQNCNTANKGGPSFERRFSRLILLV